MHLVNMEYVYHVPTTYQQINLFTITEMVMLDIGDDYDDDMTILIL